VPLKQEKMREYMREYMRKRRMAAKNGREKPAAADRRALDEARSENERLRQTIRDLEARLAAKPKPAEPKPGAAAAAEPEIDIKALSLSNQKKVEIYEKQLERRYKQQFEQRVLDEVRRRIDEIILPHWKQQIEQAQKLYKHRRGAMDKATFNKIRRAIHRDSRNSISDKKLDEAFDTFMSLEKYLLDEKDSPTEFGDLPETLAEWDKRRAAGRAKGKAKRAGINPL
jgi:hypothetical protein